MVEFIGIIVGAALVLLGIAGSVLPILPGPPLTFVGLFLLALLRHFSPPLTSTVVIVMAGITVAVTVADQVIPLVGAKKYGASKWGIFGSVAGMIAGAFFSALGVILGAFIGAVLVEWIASRSSKQALRAGWGIFIGSLLGGILKLAVSGIMAYYFVLALFRG